MNELSVNKIISSVLHLGVVLWVTGALGRVQTHHKSDNFETSSLLRLSFLMIVTLMQAATTIEKSWGSILLRLNSLLAGVMFPVLLDELHAAHDISFSDKRVQNGFPKVIPFIVLFYSLFSESPATEIKYAKPAKYAKIALLILHLGMILQYADFSSSNMVVTIGFCIFQWPMSVLRDVCMLTFFESLLLSTLSGLAFNYLLLYRGSSSSHINDFPVELSTNVVIVASITALGVAMLVSVCTSASDAVGRTRIALMTMGLLIVCGIVLLQTCILFEESSLTVFIKAVQWLVGFIHAGNMGPLKMSIMWVLLIALFFGVADHVSGPNIRQLKMPQEFMTPEGKYEQRFEAFSMVDFQNPKVSKVTSRKIFHLLMVAILVPPLYPWSDSSLLISYSVLALGGVLVLFVLLELLRARYTSLPVNQRPTFMTATAIYFDRFAGPTRRWGNEIIVRGRDYCAATDEVQRLDSAPGWRKWQCTKDHFSLLLGTAIPVWYYVSLYSGGFRSVLLPLMGCITVGLGDAVSAVVGSSYGRTKWAPSESGRTVEGSLAGLIASALLVMLPILVSSTSSFMGIEGWNVSALSNDSVSAALVTLVLSTALEACAKDNDNLLLALFASIVYTTMLLIVNCEL